MRAVDSLFLVVLLMSMTLLTQCKKPETAKELNIEFDSVVGGEKFSLATDYTINGKKVRFSLLRFYFSEVEVTRTSGGSTVLENYDLFKTGVTTYAVDEIEAGEINGLKFNIGLKDEVNTADPSAAGVKSPLSTNNPDVMHWSWANGYVFLKIEGTVDTDGDGLLDTPLVYHLGTSDLLREVNISGLNNPGVAEEVTMKVKFDVEKLFTNVDLSTEVETHTMNNLPLATKVMDNVPLAFTK